MGNKGLGAPLDSETCENVRKATGLTVKQITSMSTNEIDDSIGIHVGKKIEVKALLDPRLQGRGCVLLGRLVHRAEIERRLAGI